MKMEDGMVRVPDGPGIGAECSNATRQNGERRLLRLEKGGGEGGIRTPDTVARMPHFECGAIDHSATSPSGPLRAQAPVVATVSSEAPGVAQGRRRRARSSRRIKALNRPRRIGGGTFPLARQRCKDCVM